MAKLGDLTLTGASGKKYTFAVYPADTTWKDGVAGVYYVSRRTAKPDGSGDHSKIYVGETSDLKDRFENHHKQKCFEKNGYNAISILQESNENTRLAIEGDLVDALSPPCND